MLPNKMDTRGESFLAVKAPEMTVDFVTKAPKLNATGQPIYAASLVRSCEFGEEVIIVKVAGQPKGITTGTPVTVHDLIHSDWEIGDRHGVSFRASAIEAKSPVVPKA